MGAFDIFSTKPAEEAAAAKKRGLTQGFGEASRYLTQGADKAAGYYGQAGAMYDPALERITKGYDAYGDAAGAGGAEGYDRARANFQTGPGYQFAVDQGLEAAKRASGGVYSGGLLDELTRRGQGYANQEWGNYMSRLAPYLQQYLPAIGAQAGWTGRTGDTYGELGGRLGDLAWRKETGMGDADASAQLARYNASGNIFGALTGGLSLAGRALGAAY
jgi:hypothetical protein